MKLTLRRANTLQLLINDQIAATQILTNITVSKFDNVEELIKNSVEKLDTNLQFRLLLTQLYYNIRKKVGKASQDAGIADLLTDLNAANKAEALYKSLINNQKAMEPVDVLKARQEDLKNQSPTAATVAYRSFGTFETSLISQSGADAIVKQLSNIRKEKQKISDKLLHLNVSTEIELTEQEQEILTKLDLL